MKKILSIAIAAIILAPTALRRPRSARQLQIPQQRLPRNSNQPEIQDRPAYRRKDYLSLPHDRSHVLCSRLKTRYQRSIPQPPFQHCVEFRCRSRIILPPPDQRSIRHRHEPNDRSQQQRRRDRKHTRQQKQLLDYHRSMAVLTARNQNKIL